jgi:flagellar hook-basal body complex protein FliE
MNRIDNSSIQEMAAQIKAMAAQASPAKPAGGADNGSFASSKVDFGDVLKATLEKVNTAQNNANDLSQRFALGDNSVSISDVMITEQKANIAMQATLQVRNRLLSAYNSIISMSI